MDHVNVLLNNEPLFDLLCHGPNSLPSAMDLTLITKDKGTEAGRPIVLLAFSVQLPDGSCRTAQYTLTGRLFASMAAAFRGRYGSDGDSVQTADRVN